MGVMAKGGIGQEQTVCASFAAVDSLANTSQILEGNQNGLGFGSSDIQATHTMGLLWANQDWAKSKCNSQILMAQPTLVLEKQIKSGISLALDQMCKELLEREADKGKGILLEENERKGSLKSWKRKARAQSGSTLELPTVKNGGKRKTAKSSAMLEEELQVVSKKRGSIVQVFLEDGVSLSNCLMAGSGF
ncbi:unnamed protein product [Ilex paraguariensis]|uniref:Uncharacterized protein n=1 Tax=Ilex paraguariensis TaxID=185542 RepID=A0ABC8TCW5_9AQUA